MQATRRVPQYEGVSQRLGGDKAVARSKDEMAAQRVEKLGKTGVRDPKIASECTNSLPTTPLLRAMALPWAMMELQTKRATRRRTGEARCRCAREAARSLPKSR